MTLSRSLFFAILTALLLSMLLSFLPDVSWDGDQSEMPVYQPNPEDSSTLVDFLVISKFEHRIHNVKVVQSSLRIDFIVEEKSPSEEKVYQDLAQLIFGGFSNFDQVKEFWVRFIIRNNDEERLLIGIVADRNGFHRNEVKANWTAEEIKEYINQNFQVSYGPLWQGKKNLHSN